MRPLLPSMRRHRVFPAAVRSATVALVLVAMLFRTTSCGGRVEHQLGNHDHPALFFARKAGVGEGCTSTSRRRRRTISQGQARAVTRSPSACGFLTPSRPFPAIGTATVTRRVSRPAPTAVQRKASRADVEVGAITGADVDAEHSRGTLGDREERRLFLPHHQERDLREVVGAGSATAAAVVVDPMKTKLGKSELEVCRVINGLCQGPLDDTSGDCTDALRSMDRLAESGLTTFQLGNAAGGGRALAERRAGSYLKSAAGAASGSPEVRFLNTLSLRRGVAVTREAVKAALEVSLRRMGVERLDLVQLCWHDFEDRYFLDALYYLEESECVSNVGGCGFPAAPLALAGANGFTVVSNLVASSLIKAPGGGGGDDAGLQRPTTLARQCREQGVTMISSSGASLGGFAADEWAYRDAPSGFDEESLSLEYRLALSEILAWGSSSSSSSSSSSERAPGDPWRLYQTRLLAELQAVARKHGRGLSPADVATAFHLYRRTGPPFPELAGAADPRANSGTEPQDTIGTSVDAATIPVRVKSEGSLSGRRLADAEEDRVAGRRGAELADMLDLEDLERVAAAVGEGVTSRGAHDGPGRTTLDWEQDLLGGVDGGEEEEDVGDGELWSLGVGAEGPPTIFL